MSNKPVTHVAIVFDKSGSMASTKQQAIEGYNEQVQQFKENAKTQDIRVSLVTFNGHVFEHLWEEPAEKLTEATAEDYIPNGSTALRDAVGYTIQKLLDTTDTEDENAAYLVIVISDGQNTDEGPYTKAALREMIDACQKTNRWTFTYLGCSASYLEEIARETGISASNLAAWSNATPDQAKYGLRKTAEQTGKYFQTRSMGGTSSVNYMNDDATGVADFTQVVDESSGGKVPPAQPQPANPRRVTCDMSWNPSVGVNQPVGGAAVVGGGVNGGAAVMPTSNAAAGLSPAFGTYQTHAPTPEPVEPQQHRSIKELKGTMKYDLKTASTGNTVFANSQAVNFQGRKQ
jgi:uncharacterized protein YegL